MAERTTFEEAKQCPKCGKPGEDRSVTPAPNLPIGTTLHHIYCTTELCPWYNTAWVVQVNKDGSIPAPKNHTGEPKHYQQLDDPDLEKRIIEALELQREMETQKGSEIRNPNSGR